MILIPVDMKANKWHAVISNIFNKKYCFIKKKKNVIDNEHTYKDEPWKLLFVTE